MAKFNITDYGFERTVWANIQLAKMCPGNNIAKFEEIMNDEDTANQLETMINITLILNQAFERKATREDPEREPRLLTKDILLDLDDDTLATVCLTALGEMKEGGKVTVEAEPIKKEEAEENQSSLMKAGSYTSAT